MWRPHGQRVGAGDRRSRAAAAISPPAKAAATNSMATNSSPLPRNTEAKNRSSRCPIRSRTTPMNHKKAIPAKGTRFSAMTTARRARRICQPRAGGRGIGRCRDDDEDEGQAEQQREKDSRGGRGRARRAKAGACYRFLVSHHAARLLGPGTSAGRSGLVLPVFSRRRPAHRQIRASADCGTMRIAAYRSSGSARHRAASLTTRLPLISTDLSRRARPLCLGLVLPRRLNARKVRACGTRYAAGRLLKGPGRT